MMPKCLVVTGLGATLTIDATSFIVRDNGFVVLRNIIVPPSPDRPDQLEIDVAIFYRPDRVQLVEGVGGSENAKGQPPQTADAKPKKRTRVVTDHRFAATYIPVQQRRKK